MAVKLTHGEGEMKAECYGTILWTSDKPKCIVCGKRAKYFIDYVLGKATYEKTYCKKHFGEALKLTHGRGR